MAQVAFPLWGLPEVDLLASSPTTQWQHYYTLSTPLPLWAFGLNAFNHPLIFQVCYVFPPPTLVTLVLSKFLAEDAKGQLRLLVLVAPCWMEGHWLPTVCNILGRHSSMLSHLKKISSWMFGRLYAQGSAIYAFNSFTTQRCVLQTGTLFLSLFTQWWGQRKCWYDEGLPIMLEGIGRLVCSRGCTKPCHICP